MEDLARWLRAQLDEDERIARDKLCINCGNHTAPLESPLGITGYTHAGGHANEQGEWEQGWEGRRCPGLLLGATPVQDPARVLREIDAKRRTLVRCEETLPAANPMLVHFAKQTIRELALPYSGRDGYERALAGFK